MPQVPIGASLAETIAHAVTHSGATKLSLIRKPTTCEVRAIDLVEGIDPCQRSVQPLENRAFPADVRLMLHK